MKVTRSVGYAALVSPAVLSGSYMGASAAFSFNGDDFSVDGNGARSLATCDREADATKVKGVWDFDFNGGGNGAVTDPDGSNGNCWQVDDVGARIQRHQTCEAPDFLPDPCGEWVNATQPK